MRNPETPNLHIHRPRNGRSPLNPVAEKSPFPNATSVPGSDEWNSGSRGGRKRYGSKVFRFQVV
jgi:hypothetical protein